MLISNISFHKNNVDEDLYVTIHISKTDQRSLSSNMIICKRGDEMMRPLRLLNKYLQMRTLLRLAYTHILMALVLLVISFRRFYRNRCPSVKSETILDLIHSG
jgi:hypothetical protein